MRFPLFTALNLGLALLVSVSTDACPGKRAKKRVAYPAFLGVQASVDQNAPSSATNYSAQPGKGFSAGFTARKVLFYGFGLETGLNYRQTSYSLITDVPHITEKNTPTYSLTYNVNYSALEMPLTAIIKLGGCCNMTYGLRAGGSLIKPIASSSGYESYPVGAMATPMSVNNALTGSLTGGGYISYKFSCGWGMELQPGYRYMLSNPLSVNNAGGNPRGFTLAANVFYKLDCGTRVCSKPVMPAAPAPVPAQ